MQSAHEGYLVERGRVHPYVARGLLAGNHDGPGVLDVLWFYPPRSSNFRNPLCLELGVGGAAYLQRTLQLRCRIHDASSGFHQCEMTTFMGPAFSAYYDVVAEPAAAMSPPTPRGFAHFLCHLFRHATFAFDIVMCQLGAFFINNVLCNPTEAAKRAVLLVERTVLDVRLVPRGNKLVALGVRTRYSGISFVVALFQQCQMPFATRDLRVVPLHTFPPLSGSSYAAGLNKFHKPVFEARSKYQLCTNLSVVYGSVFRYLLLHRDWQTAVRLALTNKFLLCLFRGFLPALACFECRVDTKAIRNAWYFLGSESPLRFQRFGEILDALTVEFVFCRHFCSEQKMICGLVLHVAPVGSADVAVTYISNGWEVRPRNSLVINMVALYHWALHDYYRLYAQAHDFSHL